MEPEDEAFEELALKQGHWQYASGWRKKQIMKTSMTDKEALIERLATTCLGLDAVDPLRLLVGDVVLALRQTPQRTEQNFCPRCGKRTKDMTHIHTCTPPSTEGG